VEELFLPTLDLSVGVLLLILLTQRIPAVLQSADQTAHILGRISSIPWSDLHVDAADKVVQFLSNCQELLTLMQKQTLLNTLCGYMLIALVIRVILATSAHPRLAMLTGTLSRAADDMCVLPPAPLRSEKNVKLRHFLGDWPAAPHVISSSINLGGGGMDAAGTPRSWWA
jgi:hypothetical protein